MLRSHWLSAPPGLPQSLLEDCVFPRHHPPYLGAGSFLTWVREAEGQRAGAPGSGLLRFRVGVADS